MSKHITTARRKKVYSEPSNAVAQYFWRWKMWIDSTFVLGMLEPWENFLVVAFFLLVTGLLVAGIIAYLPHHLAFLSTRARFYFFGNEKEAIHVDWAHRLEH